MKQRSIDKLLAKYGNAAHRETYKGTIGDLFPPDEEMSAWLMRLVFLREDLRFERSNLGLSEEDGGPEVLRLQNFLRKATIMLLEIMSVARTELREALTKRPEVFSAQAKNLNAPNIQCLEDAEYALEVVRHRVAGDVRPHNLVAVPPGGLKHDNADPLEADAEDVEPPAPPKSPEPADALRQWKDFGVTIFLDAADGSDTDLSEAAFPQLAFAWPGRSASAESLGESHDKYKAVVFPCMKAAARLIDRTIWCFLRARGLRPVEVS